MKRQMRNMTYRNLMSAIHKIEAKGYSFPEAELVARNIFTEFQARSDGLSIEERIRLVLTKEEWEQDCRETREQMGW